MISFVDTTLRCPSAGDHCALDQGKEGGGGRTLTISLPDTLKAFVDEQVSQRGYGTSSEYVRELIRKDQDRLQLRSLLISGAESPPAAVADGNYFEGLRDKVRKAAGTTPKA